MTQDPLYDVYLVVVLFGTPFAMVFIIVHDIRLMNRLMHRVWKPFRWWLMGMVIVSPAELLESLNRSWH